MRIVLLAVSAMAAVLSSCVAWPVRDGSGRIAGYEGAGVVVTPAPSVHVGFVHVEFHDGGSDAEE